MVQYFWDDFEDYKNGAIYEELALNTLVGWIPVVNSIVNYFVKDYDLEVGGVAMINDILGFFKNTFTSIPKAFKGNICFVFTAEGIGAVLLMFRLIPLYGLHDGMLYSVFQSVSAFCNSGLDLFGTTSLEIFNGDIYINLILLTIKFVNKKR